eukprot:6176550-Pleurochrysis_carterae.AAC.3
MVATRQLSPAAGRTSVKRSLSALRAHRTSSMSEKESRTRRPSAPRQLKCLHPLNSAHCPSTSEMGHCAAPHALTSAAEQLLSLELDEKESHGHGRDGQREPTLTDVSGMLTSEVTFSNEKRTPSSMISITGASSDSFCSATEMPSQSRRMEPRHGSSS